MLWLKFHKNRLINEEFDFRGEQIISGALEGAEEAPDYKNLKYPHTERWSQHSPKISAF